jgi:hypothetical protein
MKSSTCKSLKLIVSFSPLTLLFLGITSLDAEQPQSSRRPHPRSPSPDDRPDQAADHHY